MALGSRSAVRRKGNYDNVFMTSIERVGRNDKRRTLFNRGEISEGERNQYNSTAFITDHTPCLLRYSRTRTTVQQVGEAHGPLPSSRLISAVGQATAAGLHASISRLRVQFVPVRFAYAHSISSRSLLSNDGLIDVRIYNRALSANEVMQLYNIGL